MKKDLIPPLPREQYAAVAIEKLRRDVRSPNGKVWAHDAWWIIKEAIQDVAGDMKSGAPCAVLMYTEYSLMALKYLRTFPDQERLAHLASDINRDTLAMVVCVEHLSRTSSLDLQDSKQIRDAIQRLNTVLMSSARL